MKKIIFLLVLSSYFNIIAAQQQPSFQNLVNVSTVPPQQASITKFGNIPVSYCTGIPSITIPIYDINIGSIKLPISLDYHAGGVRVDETSSSVGTGWALSGIPMITRTLVGLPDEWNISANLGFYGAPDAADYTSIVANHPTYPYDIKKSQVDAEPDIFQYSVAGQSGKFILNKDGTVFQIPATNNKIIFSLSAITITTPEGIVYTFDNGLQSYSSNTSIPHYISTWQLSKIADPNSKDNILFTYETACNDSYEHPKNYSEILGTIGMLCMDGQCQNISDPCCHDFPSVNLGSQSQTQSQTITHYNSYPKEITWRGGKVSFANLCDRQDVTGSGQRLDHINVYANSVSNTSVLIKNVQLTQTYFFSNPIIASNPNAPVTEKNYRLRLDAVSLNPVNSTGAPQVYTMEYDNSPIAPRESGAQDRWGFYNGPNGSVMPLQKQLYNGMYYEFGNGTNETDATTMHACTLNSIQYPTGGKTAFTMEAHKYHTLLPQLLSASYQCNVNTGAVSSSTQTITFTVDPNSSGGYYNINIPAFGNCTSSGLGCPSQYPNIVLLDQTTNTQVLNVATPPQQQNTNYLTGTVAISLISGHTYKVTSSVYTTNPNVKIYATFGWNYNVTQDAVKEGGGLRVKTITNYDKNGTFINRETFEYGDDNAGVVLTPQYYQDINFEIVNNRLSCTNMACVPSLYFYESDPGLNPVGYSVVYHSNSILPTSQYSGSPVLYRKVTKYQEDASGNRNGKIVYSYQVYQDGSINGNTPITAPTPQSVPSTGIYLISNTWRNGFLTGEDIYKSISTAPYYSLISQKKYTPLTLGFSSVIKMKIKSNYVTTGTEQTFEDGGHPDFSLTSVPITTGALVIDNSSETVYDDNGNNLTTTEDYTYNDLTHFFPTSKQNTSSRGQTILQNIKYPHDFAATGNVYQKMVDRNIISPVVQIIKKINGTQTNLATNNYYDWNNDSKLLLAKTVDVQILNNAIETRLFFNLYDGYGNIREQQKASDVKEVYLWGYNYQYPVAKITGADYTTVETLLGGSTAVSNFSSSVPTDQLVNSFLAPLRTGLPKALITTFTYKPLVGMTSQTDPRGKTNTFEYDGFNRLKLIRDQDGKIVKQFEYQYQQ